MSYRVSIKKLCTAFYLGPCWITCIYAHWPIFKIWTHFKNVDTFSQFSKFSNVDPILKFWSLFKVFTHFHNVDPFSKFWPKTKTKHWKPRKVIKQKISKFQKWSNQEIGSTFWKWFCILKIVQHFENFSTFSKWIIILKTGKLKC